MKTLCETPLALPVIYSVIGTKPGESFIIERKENDYNLIEGSNATGNHWQTYDDKVMPRGDNSFDRRDLIMQQSWDELKNFGWVKDPVLNKDTRLAVELCVATSELRARGYEEDGPATLDFELKLEKAACDIPVA